MSAKEMKGVPQRGASTLWIMLLTAASTVTTLALACATPFPALAALAAVHMRRRDGVALVLAAWLASQVVGFCIHDYPRDLETAGWAVGLATAAVASVLGAYGAIARTAQLPAWLRLAAAYVSAFIAFKLAVLVWAIWLGGVEMAFAPGVVMRQFVQDAAILAGLMMLYRAMTAIGVPAVTSRTQTRAA
ncbi:MAG: hypothetical protein ACO1NM_07970 [Sphingobium phenoxybenzoativorans]